MTASVAAEEARAEACIQLGKGMEEPKRLNEVLLWFHLFMFLWNLNFVDAVGFTATRAIASSIVKPGGVVAHIGLGSAEGGLDIRRMTLQEITFCGTYTYTSADFRETAEAIFKGDFGRFDWVEQRSLRDGAQAFDDLLNGRVDAGKVVLMSE